MSGETKYSEVLKVIIGKASPAYVISPNPVVGGVVQLQFINKAKELYNNQLFNDAGQAIMRSRITDEEGSSTELINFSNRITKGSYTLHIIAPDKSSQSMRIVIKSLD